MAEFEPPKAASQMLVAVTQTSDAIGLIDSAVKAIRDAKLGSYSEVPSLPSHLEAAKGLANQWTSQLRQLLLENVDTTRTFASTFVDTTYSELTNLLRVANSSGGNSDPLYMRLTELRSQTQASMALTRDVAKQLGDFRSSVATISREFGDDASKARSLEYGDRAEVKELRKQLAALDATIKRDRALELLGWLAGPLGYLVARLLGSLIDNEKGMQDRIASMQQQITQDRREIADLARLAAGLGSVLSGADHIVTGVTALGNGWDVLGAELRNILGGSDIKPGAFAQAQLDAMKSDFDDLINIADRVAD